MSPRFLRLFIRFLVITMTLSFCYSTKFLRKDHQQNFSLLLDFTCATAKDELEKHPEMRTIAMVELENNFPSEFSREVLKCLPLDVAKIIINPHIHIYGYPIKNATLMLPKETFVIYIAEKVDLQESFLARRFAFVRNSPVVSHLSKHLIVSSDEAKFNRTEGNFKELLNCVQIYRSNQKVIARIFDITRNLTSSETFESSQRENLSQILFPDKAKNLNRKKIFAVWNDDPNVSSYEGSDRPTNKWIPYFDIIAEKLNATLKFTQIFPKGTNFEIYMENKQDMVQSLFESGRLDFCINFNFFKHDLESYSNDDWCFMAPLPKPFSITELILFLPMDKSCWMWLGITIAVSTFLWRISEGHWSFAFGFFSYFMGQAQLIIRIRTNRLTMKILLQLLIFAIFIFSNGYQSLVTSFMLNPMQQKLLKSIDEVLDSDLKIDFVWPFQQLYGDNPKYQKAKQDGRVVKWNGVGGENWTEEMIEKNVAIIQSCNLKKFMIESLEGATSFNGIHIINEVVFALPTNLFTPPFYPYIEKFQELMDRSFEAGLHQAWERFFWETWRKEYYKKHTREEEKEILDFEMIAPSLYILAFGLPSALLALFCEIFWKDFVMELTKKYFERKWKEIFGRKIKIEKNKFKVRRIQVKPAVRRRSSI